MDNQKSFFERRGVIITMKLLMMGILILLLLIPKFMIQELVRERMQRQEDVKSEITGKYPGYQNLVGPVLKIPYLINVPVKDQEGQFTGEMISKTKFGYFLPEELNIEGDVETEKLYRSIYEVIVYSSELYFSGKFSGEFINGWKESRNEILWDDSELIFTFTDQKGIKEIPVIKWNDREIVCESGINEIAFSNTDNYGYYDEYGYHNQPANSGIHANLSFDDFVDESNNFSFTIKLDGSDVLFFVPLGKTTNVSLESNWADPSFTGNFLPEPETKNISEDGFSADWKVLHLNRNLPQYWEDSNSIDVLNTRFGVDFKIEANHYQKSERSVKYMILVIVLTFLIFFLTEILHKLKVHIFQYILVGFSISIFFVLLLALAEIIGFNPAYLIAAVSVIGLNTLYATTFFKRRQSILLLLALSIIIFGFIFTIIQLAEFSLLVGAIGLFIVIAITMYVTRKINWFEA